MHIVNKIFENIKYLKNEKKKKIKKKEKKENRENDTKRRKIAKKPKFFFRRIILETKGKKISIAKLNSMGFSKI